jgi:hypothetical protein
MVRIVFHAGTHKTGTTSIQGVLAANRNLLANRGIYYPSAPDFFGTRADLQSANAHFALAQAIARFSFSDQDNIARFLAHLRTAGPGYSVVLLSAESVYRHMVGDYSANEENEFYIARQRFVERFAGVLKEYPVDIVLYFRRPDRFAESLYAGSVAASKTKRSFEDFVTHRIFKFDYRFQIDLFAERFSTRVYCYEEKAQAGLVASFFRDNGLGEAPAAGSALRRSIPNRAVRWLQRANAVALLSRREQRRRWLFALQPDCREMFRSDEPSTFWRSTAERDAFIRKNSANVPELSFPDAGPEMVPFCDWTDAMHQNAEVAFQRWQATNKTWIAEREAAKLPPFVPSQSLSA